MEFTKKDSLFKAETPVFNSYKDVKKGDKIVNVIVAETEHGFVTTTFGNVKGLLTFEDIKEKLSDGYDESLFKVGNIVNAYVLFKKKDKGVALTLSKKKAKITGQEEEGKNVSTTLETGYFP
jgi:ribosomal protein S1